MCLILKGGFPDCMHFDLRNELVENIGLKYSALQARPDMDCSIDPKPTHQLTTSLVEAAKLQTKHSALQLQCDLVKPVAYV